MRIETSIQTGEQVLISSLTGRELSPWVAKEQLSLATDLDTWL
jgi:hypothetical protein